MVYLVYSSISLSEREEQILFNIGKLLEQETSIINLAVVPLPQEISLQNVYIIFGDIANKFLDKVSPSRKIVSSELSKLVPGKENTERRQLLFKKLEDIKLYIQILSSKIDTDLTIKQLTKLSLLIEKLGTKVSILDKEGKQKYLDIVNINELILIAILQQTLETDEIEIKW